MKIKPIFTRISGLTLSLILFFSLTAMPTYALSHSYIAVINFNILEKTLHPIYKIYANRHNFNHVSTIKLEDQKAEVLDSNTLGNRIIVAGGKSGILTMLDTSDLENISVLNTLNLNDELAFFIRPLLKELDNNHLNDTPADYSDIHFVIRADVTDIKYMTGDRYAVATIRFYGPKGYKDNDKDYPLLSSGALAMIDLESFYVKSMHITGPRPDALAISNDHRYILVANEGYEDDLDPTLNKAGSVWRYELFGANIIEPTPIRMTSDFEKKLLSTRFIDNFEPESISTSPTEMLAAVSLQDSNQLAFIDIEKGVYTDVFALGTSQHLADFESNDKINFDFHYSMRLEPDTVKFTLDGSYIYSINEGNTDTDLLEYKQFGGGRSISVLDLKGETIYNSSFITELKEAYRGLYKDSSSNKHGSQLEYATTGIINNTPYLFVTAEQSDCIHIFNIQTPDQPEYLGLVKSGGKSPEGITFIQNKNAFICANEKSGSISVFVDTSDQND